MRILCYISLLIVFFLQAACKKSSDQVEPSESNEKYIVTSIEYAYIPGNLAEENIDQRPNLEYINRTNIRQKVVVNPDGVYERSTFKKRLELQQNYFIDDQNQLFSVPVEIKSNEVLLGMKKWMYNEEEETKIPSQLNLKDSVYVDPGKKLIGQLSITYKKIQTTYTAQLKGQSSGKTVTVTGTWTGSYPIGKNFTYKAQDI